MSHISERALRDTYSSRPTVSPDIYEQIGRLTKVVKLLPVVAKYAAELGEQPSALARRMDAAERAEMCSIAGVNVASDKAWQVVVDALAAADATFAGIAS